MLRKLMVVAGFAVAMAFSTGVAHADTITGTTTGPSCPGCPAATYTLTVSGTPSQLASGTNLTVTLTISTSGSATITSGDSYISAVAFKLSSGVSGATLSTAPGTLGDWGTAALDSTISNSNCQGSGAGFVCNTDASHWTDALVTQGGTLTWTWNGVNIGGPVGDPSTWSLKVKYNDNDGDTNGLIISDNAVGVPEPGTLALLGIGLVPMLGFGRRFFS
jgi:hypothetical protein